MLSTASTSFTVLICVLNLDFHSSVLALIMNYILKTFPVSEKKGLITVCLLDLLCFTNNWEVKVLDN